MSLTALLTSASLLVSPAEIDKTTAFYQHIERPQIYAQAAQDARDESLERMLLAYKNLIFKPGASKRIFEMALEFYDDVVKDNKGRKYTAEAYYYSGLILAQFIDPKNVKEGIRRLELAYELGGNNLKVEAALRIGDIVYHNAAANEKGFAFEHAEEYLRRVIQLAPKTGYAKEAEELIQKIRFSKTK